MKNLDMDSVDKANASVAAAREEAQTDPLRPIYHLAPPAYWLNDPNGLIYFEGRYHVFYQHNPYGADWGNMSWGHCVSEDLAHWEHWPIALVPTPEGCDKDGVFSGCCVLENGTPTILYTGVEPEVQCRATSHDGMRTWRKDTRNPIPLPRPTEKLEGFRDPFVWREGETWLMALGSGIDGQGGAVLLYASEDLWNWRYLHPLCVGPGMNWECPLFFPLEDKHVLIVSPHGPVRYSVGRYADRRFEAGPWRTLDLGEDEVFYAPNVMQDPQGRWLLWGWIRQGGSPDAPWNGCLSLPRVLSLREDDTLGVSPAPELKALRGAGKHFDPFTLAPGSANPLAEIRGDALEIKLEVALGNAEAVGLHLRASMDGAEKTTLLYNAVDLTLSVDDYARPAQIPPGEKTLRLHIFLDKSVLEIYLNESVVMTRRCFPKESANTELALFSQGQAVEVRSLSVWPLESSWKS